MLLSAARESWQYAGTLANHSPRSLEWRDQKLGRFVMWCRDQGITDVEQLTVPIVHRFLATLSPTLSDFTRNGYARVLRAFLYYCVREELLPEKLPKRLQMPKVPQKVIATLSAEQIKRLMAAAAQEPTPGLTQRDRALLAVLLDTGLRASELCGLTLEHVHFSPQDTYLQVLGKGRKERQVGLGDRARLELHRWVYRHRLASSAEPHVFVNWNGKPLTRHGLDQVLYRLRDYAGREHFQGVRVSAHTCRHTMAVTYLAQGGDIYKLSRILGHSTVTTTEVYLRAMTARAARQGLSVFDHL